MSDQQETNNRVTVQLIGPEVFIFYVRFCFPFKFKFKMIILSLIWNHIQIKSCMGFGMACSRPREVSWPYWANAN